MIWMSNHNPLGVIAYPRHKLYAYLANLCSSGKYYLQMHVNAILLGEVMS